MKSSLDRRKKMKVYSRNYRKKKPGKVAAYNKKTVKQRSNRNKARRKMARVVGKSAIRNMDIHHKNHNALDNSMGNLSLRKRHHEGGPKKR
jgi:hypothetical protein